MNLWKTARRAYNRFYSDMVVRRKEKEFCAANGTKLRHMLFRNSGSDVLVIGFSSRDPRGAVYHYVHTLAGTGANRLYIKDDYARNGTYYLGSHLRFNIEEAVFELIDKTIEECGAKKLFFIGSSKGGYAAVNFGIRYPHAAMVVAAPTYYVGSVMRDRKGYADAVIEVLDEPVTPEKIAMLNARLKYKIVHNELAPTQHLFIHYSKNEPYYEEHVRELLEDVSASGMAISEDLGTYTEHVDLRLYYPDYLVKTVNAEKDK